MFPDVFVEIFIAVDSKVEAWGMMQLPEGADGSAEISHSLHHQLLLEKSYAVLMIICSVKVKANAHYVSYP